MGQISLRPELITRGGEACGIMVDDHYVGTFMLLYREEDRLLGSVQLDEEMVGIDEKEEIDLFIHRHIENMLDALTVPECFVTLTYSHYDHVLTSEDIGPVQELTREEEMLLDEEEPMMDEEHFRLIIVGESRNRVEYHIENFAGDWMADAILRITRADVTGEIIWQYDPSEEEMDALTKLLVSDFHSEEVDTFTFAMYYDDEELAIVELTHEDVQGMEDFTEDIPESSLERLRRTVFHEEVGG